MPAIQKMNLVDFIRDYTRFKGSGNTIEFSNNVFVESVIILKMVKKNKSNILKDLIVIGFDSVKKKVKVDMLPIKFDYVFRTMDAPKLSFVREKISPRAGEDAVFTWTLRLSYSQNEAAKLKFVLSKFNTLSINFTDPSRPGKFRMEDTLNRLRKTGLISRV